MSKEYPSFKATMGGAAVITVPLLWYFDWAGWAWGVAVAIVVVCALGWLQEALKVHRENELGGSDSDSHHPAGGVSAGLDDDDVMAGGRLVWEGSRTIRFAYQSFEADNSDREVTVHKVVSKGRSNGDTYFNGYCHLRGEPRTFRLDRIKGKVTDTSTGEMATFRQLFEMSAR